MRALAGACRSHGLAPSVRPAKTLRGPAGLERRGRAGLRMSWTLMPSGSAAATAALVAGGMAASAGSAGHGPLCSISSQAPAVRGAVSADGSRPA
ncbi:MAG TPA: hypothetical protein VHY58_12280 [Streptosporangiaceae bacterium]|nr:hypothetical protein [Streptosporangiaceae bacterium]